MSQEMYQAVITSTDSSQNKDKVPSGGAAPNTPIQILHEYGVKHGKIPTYVLEKSEGEVHQPNFVFSVTVGEVCCKGEGSSKKAAKHVAAEVALRNLQVDITDMSIPIKSESNSVVPESNGTSNSVGTLQELCLQRGWRLPDYTMLTETGPPHEPEFTFTCTVESLSETASGISKKAAKKAAADKMVAKLQSLSGSTEITWVGQLLLVRLEALMSDLDSFLSCQTPKPWVRFENLKNSSAEKISLLRRNPLSIPNMDYIQMLAELSAEQKFDVAYSDIDELTANGQYQCLVELSTYPVTVCHGTGISCTNAHHAAAHNALQYVKIVASSSK
ncbi:interferon-inducible double-stranded RNA-dependent protein kinase activator A homolog isoform X1 [Stigmatopora nigra]